METETNHDLAVWGGITLTFCILATIATRSQLLAGLTLTAFILTGVALWLDRTEARRARLRVQQKNEAVDAYLERMPHE